MIQRLKHFSSFESEYNRTTEVWIRLLWYRSPDINHDAMGLSTCIFGHFFGRDVFRTLEWDMKHSYLILIFCMQLVSNNNNNNNDNDNNNKLLWDFSIQTDHLIPARRLDLIIINKKKGIYKTVDFAVPADHRINLKEYEKKDKYLDLARELKKLWNMKVTIVPIVIGVFGTITKGLLKGLEDSEVGGRAETIQMTALLRTAGILRRVLETWGDLLSLKLQ